MTKQRQFFGTDGIRGRVGEEPITPESVLKLGWAAGKVLGADQDSTVVIGKDTRVSGYLLESALQAGLSAAGVNVSLLGPMPTPAIAYFTRTSRAQAGVVISASHNPYYDNGIKFFSPDGHKLPDETEFAIEQMLEQPISTVDSAHLGKATRFPDAVGRYVEYCKSTIPSRATFSGVSIVVDCANGAGYHVMPDVFSELGADVTVIHNEPDGFNINENCGSTQPAALQAAVKRHGADVGVALDGDGDRVAIVDEQGRLVDGDGILYVLAMARKRRGLMDGGVVGTVMTNLGLELAFREQGIDFERASVGDRYVLQTLEKRQWQLGGESSGHIICLDKSTTGDGIIAGLEVVMSMIEAKSRLSELLQGLPVYPQKMINVKLDDLDASISAKDLPQHELVLDRVAKAEKDLGDEGRVLIRPSGTEPVVRVMVESSDAARVERWTRELAESVEAAARGGSPTACQA